MNIRVLTAAPSCLERPAPSPTSGRARTPCTPDLSYVSDVSIRRQLGTELAAGLGGWLQLLIAQKVEGLAGEDSARLIAAQIVNAQGRFSPATSQLPPNWGRTKKRIDIALKAKSRGAKTWYGAIEIKWLGTAFDPQLVRLQMVQDAMRLTFIKTNNVNAAFLLLGGPSDSLARLFEKSHPRAKDREGRRLAFEALFPRDADAVAGEADHATWRQHFPNADERVPSSVFGGFDGKLKTELLGMADAHVGGDVRGSVYVWQCNRTRGRGRQ